MHTCKEGSAVQDVCGDAPKGQQQTSPGQRPGTTSRRNDRALKGRHKPFCSALSGLENKLGTMTNLGRCPRLVCGAPLGRNSATADNPMNAADHERGTFPLLEDSRLIREQGRPMVRWNQRLAMFCAIPEMHQIPDERLGHEG